MMSFLGKVLYIVLFPGFFFLVFSGSVLLTLRSYLLRDRPSFPFVPIWIARITREGNISNDDIEPIRIFLAVTGSVSISLLSCIIFGFIKGDVFLCYILLVLFFFSNAAIFIREKREKDDNSADSTISLKNCLFTYENGNSKQNLRGFAFLALFLITIVFSGVSLRTVESSVHGIMSWQVAHGMTISSREGGTFEVLGSVFLFISAFLCLLPIFHLTLEREKQLIEKMKSEGGYVNALMSANMASCSFLASLLLSAFFLAGPAGAFHEILWWALKVLMVFFALSFFSSIIEKRASLWRFIMFAGIIFSLAGLASIMLVV
ncbi:MAG: hypothetical protein PHP64_04250 [Actinomycetota bacterium]|nr:hypothetical protein [Actinomycetota bacterium]